MNLNPHAYQVIQKFLLDTDTTFSEHIEASGTFKPKMYKRRASGFKASNRTQKDVMINTQRVVRCVKICKIDHLGLIEI